MSYIYTVIIGHQNREIMIEAAIKRENQGHDLNVNLPQGWTWTNLPGHNYLCVPRGVVEKLPAGMKQTNYSRGGRYEEDCDWCLPVVGNLELFNEQVQKVALETLVKYHEDHVAKVIKA